MHLYGKAGLRAHVRIHARGRRARARPLSPAELPVTPELVRVLASAPGASPAVVTGNERAFGKTDATGATERRCERVGKARARPVLREL
jgi:hypothetical protein